MDVRIAVPPERFEEFKASLFDFLHAVEREGRNGFAMHSVEPEGDGLIQRVYFESDQTAAEFRSRWSALSTGAGCV
jgi:hypothetical protein